MVRRRLKHKLAVSTVIANLLMIMITLSLAAILVAWAGTSYGSFTGGSQVYFAQRGQAMQERFVVEFVNASRTGSPAYAVDMFVRNVGVEQINIVAIYINGTSITPTQPSGRPATCSPTGFPSGGQLLPVGQVCDFYFTWSHGWNSGDMINIVVASSRGNQATYTLRGP